MEIFRRCFEQLKPVAERFEALHSEREIELAGIRERIKERADSPQALQAAQQAVETLRNKVQAAKETKQAADAAKEVQEKQEQAHREAKSALESALNQFKLASQQKAEHQRQVQESLDAASALKETLAAYQAYSGAEQNLRRLQADQTRKSRLETLRANATNTKTECEGRAKAAREQAQSYGKQKKSKTEAVSALKTQITAGQKALLDTQAEFKLLTTATTSARQSREAFSNWLEVLDADVRSNEELREDIVSEWRKIAAWDPKALIEARSKEADADKRAKALAKKAAEAGKLIETLSEQLEQISGGVCPFLKEKCRQFDPKKIQSDLSTQKKEHARLDKEHSEAIEQHNQAKARVEKLTKEETKLDQARKSLAKTIKSLADTHNELFPDTVQKHLLVLGDYLPKHAPRMKLRPLDSAKVSTFFDKEGQELDQNALQHLLEGERTFHEDAFKILTGAESSLESAFDSFDKQRDERLRKERDLTNKREKLLETAAEITTLTANIDEQTKIASKADEETAAALKQITEIAAQLKPFANLDSDLHAQQAIKDTNLEGHTKYLGAKPAAEKREERQAALAKAGASELQKKEQVRRKQEIFEHAKKAFDQAALDLARQKADESGRLLATETAHLENADRDLRRELARFKEWENAVKEQARVVALSERILASIDLTQKARQVLQRAAPRVAQHVCRHIASRAQQLFNQINDDPVQLEWSAERYSLRINPGERRFAMLSGGEQTKLALAMTLALIQEFSGLKFCIFDEPTYGVDAESRHRLADAVIRLQDLAENKLDQLLLVSHDDAFEGKIENVVTVYKSAAQGTALRA